MATTRVATGLASGSVEQVKTEPGKRMHKEFGGQEPALVMLFVSVGQPLEKLLPAVRSAFPRAVVLGASSAGEFTEAAAKSGTTALFGRGRRLRGSGQCGHWP